MLALSVEKIYDSSTQAETAPVYQWLLLKVHLLQMNCGREGLQVGPVRTGSEHLLLRQGKRCLSQLLGVLSQSSFINSLIYKTDIYLFN